MTAYVDCGQTAGSIKMPLGTEGSINQSMLYCSVEQNVTEYTAKE